ncbi:hypothetical protein [Neogemmobacter tilapiae]|uniref:Uncharacterized protein n=1 Tax=Neogemmobacter tilapiae TaxID=875041 RepID=A0A918TDK3_9RHOB|nr:hypothetical protein [Gemmobacter tilapiae]GHC43205.1 hypothetical protein GCM10007315_00190 [Gemmobacter tilapiae]
MAVRSSLGFFACALQILLGGFSAHAEQSTMYLGSCSVYATCKAEWPLDCRETSDATQIIMSFDVSAAGEVVSVWVKNNHNEFEGMGFEAFTFAEMAGAPFESTETALQKALAYDGLAEAAWYDYNNDNQNAANLTIVTSDRAYSPTEPVKVIKASCNFPGSQ